MRHLSTEELLLQCDGELSFARVAHLQRCPLCKAASADLKQLLFEVEQELRATVPQEPVEERLASWLALERTLYPPPRNSGFPIRWPVVYATAAALTVAVLAGYLSSRQITGRAPQTTIAANFPDRPVRQTVLQPANPVDRPFMASAGSMTAPGGRLSASTEGLAAAPSVIERAESTVAATDAEPQRANPAVSVQERQRFDLNELGEQSLARASAPRVSAVSQGDLDLRPVLTTEWASVSAPPVAVSRPRPVFDQAQAQTPESAAALVEGHWILAKANVWTEDVRPVWVGNAIEFRGTVENTAVQKLVTAAIEKAAGPLKNFPIDLQLRSGDAETQAATTTVTLAADRRPAGGVVRNSLLTHFGDAARRSFISPQPTVLEAEIDRFVTDVFRSQSTLRSHSYALKSLMRSLTLPQVAQLDPGAAKKLRELVRMHLDAVGAGEQDIYGRLSETLPRRFWSYRAAKRELSDSADWQHESTDLLKEVLQLDATLTALLSTPQSFVDISDSHLSSGELLYRIRSRVHRIRAAAEMAR